MTVKLASQAALWYNADTKNVLARAVLDTPPGMTIRIGGSYRMDSIPQKRCTKCLQWKPATLEFFNAHKDCRYGVNSVCRQCQSLRTAPLPEVAPEGCKRCSTCKEIKPLSEFHKSRIRADGYCYSCKSCSKVSLDAVYRRKAEKNEVNGEKQCFTCEQVKPFSDFHKENGYYRNVCKECRNKERSLRVPSQIKIPEEKRCPWCKQTKPIKEFSRNPQRKDGHDTYCRDCDNTRALLTGTKVQRPPLSREEYNRKLQEQDGKCAICGRPPKQRINRRLYIDHNHQTGQIRDLLCINCNSALGMLKEDPVLINALLAYVEKWKGQS